MFSKEKKNVDLFSKLNSDGTTNTNYIDLLDEDKSITGQKFVCLSFLSPEEIIKQKEMYFLENFLNKWDMSKSMEKFTHFLSFISFKYKQNLDNLVQDLKEFCEEEKKNIFNISLNDEFKTFKDNNEEKMTEEYNKLVNYQTNTRGIKVRGSFPSQEEAEMRAKMLRQSDPNHDVYVGQVGMWMPFHPEAYKTGKVEYLEEELNKLMNEKNNNEEKAKEEFDNRIKETKKRAIEENIKKAKESGNVLTQTINEEGDLVSVTNIDTFDNKLGDNATSQDIQKELFSSTDIVTDRKLSTVTETV
jgi:hypothetical protein